ncbi:hypothetical protein OG417_11695 [Actinoallomurus sp. NBC_01490]|uniref:hypothetical protein n=1 Tax=Actinoallomurus sp. NBC_01490 TaxID=2903557 RepID=UPI002E34C79C|nr:hypothetical protein [Actinoallomurus sp. NBC_01490]
MRGLAAARLAWGGLLVTVPDLVLNTLTGRPATRSQTWVLRVLGTRHLLQAGVELAHPTRALARAGAAVDLLHAATCAGAVALLPAWRRAALVDGTGAVVFATGGLTRARLTSTGASPSAGVA